MISNAALRDELRALGYAFKKQGKRVDIWKKAGSIHRVTLSRNKQHDPRYAATILRQAGMGENEIKAFIEDETEKNAR